MNIKGELINRYVEMVFFLSAILFRANLGMSPLISQAEKIKKNKH